MERENVNKLYIVGIGAGNYDGMTLAAVKALEASSVIVGYTVYCELVRPFFPDKKYVSTPMTGELERCRLALWSAAGGETTAVICSGDAGIYGMASPVLELAENSRVEIEIIAGVTAASSGAALLGAPLGHDFAVISLSDLLTPLELIDRRVECAAMCDMCVALYNPSSKKRSDYLRRACDITLRFKSPETVCGIAKNIGRAGETAEIMTLSALRGRSADMFTTVFIGSSRTRAINGRMVTPRGYGHE